MARDTIASLKDTIASMQADAYRGTMHSCIASDEASGIAPDAVETFSDGEWRYTMSLYRSTGAVAGIVRIIGRHPGQRASVDVRRLDEMGANHYMLAWSIAVERLTLARNRILDARYGASAA